MINPNCQATITSEGEYMVFGRRKSKIVEAFLIAFDKTGT
jgi:hypothetical protein